MPAPRANAIGAGGKRRSGRPARPHARRAFPHPGGARCASRALLPDSVEGEEGGGGVDLRPACLN